MEAQPEGGSQDIGPVLTCRPCGGAGVLSASEIGFGEDHRHAGRMAEYWQLAESAANRDF